MPKDKLGKSRTNNQTIHSEMREKLNRSLLEKCSGVKYNILYVDPPWDYKNDGESIRGNALRQYQTIKTNELEKLEMDKIAADNSILLLWATSPMLDDSIDLMRAWGFEYKTVFVLWVKPDGTKTGVYTRQHEEFLLMGTKGAITKYKRLGVPYINNVIYENSQEHSRKPKSVKKIIETVFEDVPRIEIFARESNDLNWDYFGNEIDKFGSKQDPEKRKAILLRQIEIVNELNELKMKRGGLIDSGNRFGVKRNRQRTLDSYVQK